MKGPWNSHQERTTQGNRVRLGSGRGIRPSMKANMKHESIKNMKADLPMPSPNPYWEVDVYSQLRSLNNSVLKEKISFHMGSTCRACCKNPVYGTPVSALGGLCSLRVLRQLCDGCNFSIKWLPDILWGSQLHMETKEQPPHASHPRGRSGSRMMVRRCVRLRWETHMTQEERKCHSPLTGYMLPGQQRCHPGSGCWVWN